MQKLTNLQKYIHMCASIGEIPTSYLESMTYEEQMLWLCNFLENTVIPAVNENNQAVQELQHWFETLDVQEEINNKLEEMASDGTLALLIGAYIQPRIDAQNDRIEILEDEVSAMASGSPAGVYSTITALQQADPDHSKIYIVSADGQWYYWNNATSQWKNGGVYQSTGIADGSITKAKLNNNLINELIIKKNFISGGADLNAYYENGLYVLLQGQYLNNYTTGSINVSLLKVERSFTGDSASSSNQNVIIQTIIDRNNLNNIHKRVIYGVVGSFTYGNWIKEVNNDNAQIIKDYLPQNIDLNNILDQGYYGLTSGTYLHAPVSDTIKGFLEVKRVVGTYATIRQIIYSSELGFGIEDLTAERIIKVAPTGNTYGDWKIRTGETYYQYINGGDLDNYLNKGSVYLLTGNYTNSPLPTIQGGMLKNEICFTYLGLNSHSKLVVQTLTLNDNSARYVRTIRWTGDSTNKTKTNWINVYSDKETLNILTLGDSILGMPNQLITNAIKNNFNGEVYNCNFGGTTAVDRTGNQFRYFSFVNLVDSIISNNFTNQENALSQAGIPDYFESSLNRLKNIDLSNIDVCLIMYGTNDYATDYQIGNINDNNKTSILGSLRYGIKKLSEQYPNIQFIIMNPIYRHFTDGGSLTHLNANNVTLDQLDDKEIELAKNMYIGYIDMRELGINDYNYTYWLGDGVHLKDTVKNKVGNMIANNIKTK